MPAPKYVYNAAYSCMMLVVTILLIAVAPCKKAYSQSNFDTVYLLSIDTLGIRSFNQSSYGDFQIAIEINNDFAVLLMTSFSIWNYRIVNCNYPLKIHVRVEDATYEGLRQRTRKMKNWYDSEVWIDPNALGTNKIWLQPRWQGDSIVVQARALKPEWKRTKRRINRSRTLWQYDCTTGKPQLLNRKGQPRIIYEPPKTLNDVIALPAWWKQ